jgi:hypothetical protein
MSSDLLKTSLDTQALIEILLKGRLEEANKARARLREKKIKPAWAGEQRYRYVEREDGGIRHKDIEVDGNSNLQLPPLDPAMDAVIETADFSKMRERLSIGRKNWESWVTMNFLVNLMLIDSTVDDIAPFLVTLRIANSALQSLAGTTEGLIRELISSPYAPIPEAKKEEIPPPPAIEKAKKVS